LKRTEQSVARIFVVGIGYRPLEKRVGKLLSDSKAIYASDRLLDVFTRYDEYEGVRDKLKVLNSISGTIEAMKAMLRDDPDAVVTLLASGDPMFFGIGRRAVEEFGREMIEIIPDLSSMQQAFARISEPWDNAFLMSMHGGPDPGNRRKLEYAVSDIPRLLEEHKKLAILTDDINNPTVIATELAGEAGSSGVTIHICEKLGYPDEKITAGAPQEIMTKSYSEPNVVIVTKERGPR
jgi:precorrin-6Y C5,15-methyltransferase (decarboxylating)